MKALRDVAMAIVCLTVVAVFRVLLDMDDFPQG
jgi:hypothetical protein